MLKLHVAVLLFDGSPGTAARPNGQYLLVDFLPAQPQDPSTAFALLRGGSAPGVIRQKVCPMSSQNLLLPPPHRTSTSRTGARALLT
jgi:hypothetical protein